MQRGADALAAFGDRFIRQAHEIETDDAVRHLHLHVDVKHIGAFERDGGDAGNHVFGGLYQPDGNTTVLLSSRNEPAKQLFSEPIPE